MRKLVKQDVLIGAGVTFALVAFALFITPKGMMVLVKVPPPYAGKYTARFDNSVKFIPFKTYTFDFSKGEPSGIAINGAKNLHGESFHPAADWYGIKDIVASDTGKSISDRYNVRIGVYDNGQKGGLRMTFTVEEKRALH